MPYTKRPDLGKFEGCYSQWIARVLYDITMISGQDDYLGDVQDFGWYAIIHGSRGAWIVHEDSQGFFDYEAYDSALDADAAWEIIQADYEAFTEERDSDYCLDA